MIAVESILVSDHKSRSTLRAFRPETGFDGEDVMKFKGQMLGPIVPKGMSWSRPEVVTKVNWHLARDSLVRG